MNYQIIKDEQAFRDYIDWLPELTDGEQFYICLFARSKYDKTGVLKSDKSQLSRTVASKEWIYDKVKKMEVELGAYKTGNIIVPENTLALYIHTNPRSLRKASLKTAKMILEDIEHDQIRNPKSTALNALQISKSRTVWFDFDIDIEKTQENYDKIMTTAVIALGTYDFKLVETNGGYHLLINMEKIHESKTKTWHNTIMAADFKIDQKGDLMMPVVGCCQGGFVPKFLN